MVDDRRAAVLRAVVQQYIETSQPVSSSSVLERHGINASSATIRGEMAALERDGYLQQPHTSAGRIPTDLGYRFFVDNLSDPARLAAAKQQDVRSFFEHASGEIEHMLHETGRLLSDLTGAASVVIGPTHDTAIVRSAQLVPLTAHLALAVVVTSNGSVEKCTVDLGGETTEAEVHAASTHLAQHLNGLAFSAANAELFSGNALSLRAFNALGNIHSLDNSENVYVGGTSRLAHAFEAVEVVRNVLSILEKQFVVVNLMRELLDRGITVSIGTEHKLVGDELNMVPLAHCSLIVAPTVVDGETRGSIAVLGPTRMDYSQAMSAVAVVSRNLGQRLGSKQ